VRRKSFVIGEFLLILAGTVAGLGGCAKSAEVRETPAATVPAAALTPVVAGVSPAAPGETVVSAVTPQTGSQGTTVQPTPVPAGTQVTSPSQPTAVPQATVVVPTVPPSSGTTGCRIRHTVQKGEWVWQIARNYGVSPYDILAANGLTIQSASIIYPGTVLCIP
jgi:LysM repeat protein